jgi:hypothetical protein
MGEDRSRGSSFDGPGLKIKQTPAKAFTVTQTPVQGKLVKSVYQTPAIEKSMYQTPVGEEMKGIERSPGLQVMQSPVKAFESVRKRVATSVKAVEKDWVDGVLAEVCGCIRARVDLF